MTSAEEQRRSSCLEAFFDLVFVFAITQAARLRCARAHVRGDAPRA